MPKRKRDHEEDGEGDRQSAHQQRVQYKLKQATTKLGHAFKLAKGFERQKLGRRSKHAVEEKRDKDGTRIEAEIAALKTLETSTCAQHHLYKSLLKIKAVAESPKLPTVVKKPTALPTDTASLNVNARLCNSRPVKEALSDLLLDIQQVLGLEVVRKDGAKKRRLRAKDYEEDDATGEDTKKSSRPKERQALGTSLPLRTENEISGEDDMETYNDRLASGSGDEYAGSGVSNIDDLERELESEGIARRPTAAGAPQRYDHAADLSLSDPGSPSPSPSPEPRKGPKPKSSSFLPSLSLGGYISGSGSDIEDIDAPPKKNRRGQRARQQLWEKKFGTRAKHLQNPKLDRYAGWDPRRGATDRLGRESRGKGGGRRGTDEFGRESRGKEASGAPPRKDAPKKHRDDSGPIHPSWEAAKKAKEKKEAPVAFQGKKVTFD